MCWQTSDCKHLLNILLVRSPSLSLSHCHTPQYTRTFQTGVPSNLSGALQVPSPVLASFSVAELGQPVSALFADNTLCLVNWKKLADHNATAALAFEKSIFACNSPTLTVREVRIEPCCLQSMRHGCMGARWEWLKQCQFFFDILQHLTHFSS